MITTPIAAGWHRCQLLVATEGGPRPIEGWRPTPDAVLCVTPLLTDTLIITDDRFVLTHFASGVRLWPNDFTLIQAMTICAELLRLPGWEQFGRGECGRLVAAAEAIVRRHLAALA